jgi:hypothetical protein
MHADNYSFLSDYLHFLLQLTLADERLPSHPRTSPNSILAPLLTLAPKVNHAWLPRPPAGSYGQSTADCRT